VLALCAVVGVVISYYWRVFYGLDPRGVSPLQVTGFCVVLAMAAGAAALLLRRCKDFARRGAVCILLCGTLFAFADPPMQTPDVKQTIICVPTLYPRAALTLTPSVPTLRMSTS